MIYYHFDPELDINILREMERHGELPSSINSFPRNKWKYIVEEKLATTDEILVFEHNEQFSGLLWLSMEQHNTLEIRSLYMTEQASSSKFYFKLLSFSKKRAMFLQRPNVIIETDQSQEAIKLLCKELGCSSWNREGHRLICKS